MKRGKKPEENINVMIVDIIKRYRQAYPEFLRREINKKYGRLLSWNTINNHLKYLKEKAIIKEDILNKEKRKISIYRLLNCMI